MNPNKGRKLDCCFRPFPAPPWTGTRPDRMAENGEDSPVGCHFLACKRHKGTNGVLCKAMQSLPGMEESPCRGW